MENNIKTAIDILADEIIGNIRENITSYGLADGNLYNSLESNIDGNHLQILGANYFEYAMKGREPGKIPFNFSDILEEWIDRRRISYIGSKRKFANAIAWKTAREGSYLYRHPEEQRDFLKDVLDEPLSKFQESFNIFLGEQIQ